MKYDFDRHFKMRINDDWWEFYLVTEEEMGDVTEEQLGERDIKCYGLTLTNGDGYCMLIVEGYVTKNLINHELFHLYVSYFNLGSSGIDVDTFEEITAEFLQFNLDKFIKTRNKLVKRFQKLEEVGRKK